MQDKNLDQTRAPIYEALQEFKKVMGTTPYTYKKNI